MDTSARTYPQGTTLAGSSNVLNSDNGRFQYNLPEGTKKVCTFDNLKARPEVKGLQEAKTFLQRCAHPTQADLDDDAFMDIRFVTLTGTPGLGKTHLALAYGWSQLDVLYFTVSDLLQQLNLLQLTDQWAEFDSLWSRVKDMPILILDDLGTERPTDANLARLDSLIDARYRREGDAWLTIVTTNLTLAKLPPRIASRLGDRRYSKVFTLSGGDYRLSTARATVKEKKDV